MQGYVQLIISGLVMGSIYALIAVGLNTILNTTNIVNFAYGDTLMLASFVLLSLLTALGWPFLVAFLVAIVCTIVLALVIQITAVNSIGLKNLSKNANWMLTLIGASIILRNGSMIVWGTVPQPFPHIFGDNLLHIFGAGIVEQEIWVFAIAILTMIVFELLNERTSLGKALKATAFNKDAASLVGINIKHMIYYSFGLSGILAAISAVLVAPITFVHSDMGLGLFFKGFTAAIIGGMGSSRGALVGGLILGLVESLAIAFVSAGFKDAIAFVLLVIILLIRPGGLFGKVLVEKV